MGGYSKLIGSGVGSLVALLSLNVIKFYAPEFSQVVLGDDESKLAFAGVINAVFVWAFPSNKPGSGGSGAAPIGAILLAIALASAPLVACAPNQASYARPLTAEETARELQKAREQALQLAERSWQEALIAIANARRAGLVTQADIDRNAARMRGVDRALELARQFIRQGLSPDDELADARAAIAALRAELARQI